MTRENPQPETLKRSFVVAREAVNQEARTVELSFSSESPVERWFGLEILDHSEGAADFTRLNNGGPLLLNHDTREQIGVCEKAWLDAAERKGRAIVRFGKSPLAEEVFRDVVDGIRKNVSFAYDPSKAVEEKIDGKEAYRFMRWQALEISIVPIPADNSVGVGREQQDKKMFRQKYLLDHKADGGGGGNPAPAPATTPNESEIRKAERQRFADITALGKRHNCADEANKHITDGKTVEEFRTWVLENRFNAQPVQTADPDIGLSRKERQEYSIVRAMRCLAEKKPLDGLEREASDAVAKKIRRDAGGFFIPHDIVSARFDESKGLTQRDVMALAMGLAQMRTMTAMSGPSGGFTIGTNVMTGSMIELLRNNMVVGSLGARSLSGLVGNIAIPRQTGGAAAYWLSENASVTPSDQAFGQLGLTPKRLAALTKYSKQLLMQSSIDIEAFVREDLMKVLALAKDLAAIAGTGADGQPLGVMNTTGIGSVTYGGAPSWAKVVENETALFTANVTGTPAFLSSFATNGKWKTTPKVTNQAVFLMDSDNSANGYRFAATTQIPSGDKTIFGVWSELIIADWDGMDVVVDPYSEADRQIVKIVINTHTDLAVRHPAAFVLSTDSAAQ